MHINMQIELNVMDQFIVIFLVLLLAKMIHQTSFFWQIHEQVVTPQIFYVFDTMSDFSIIIFNGIAFIIDISIKITLISSCSQTLTIIIDEFLTKINKFGCICNNNSEKSSTNGRKFLQYKNNYNYDSVNEIHRNLHPIDPTRVERKENYGNSYDCNNFIVVHYITPPTVSIKTLFWDIDQDCEKMHCIQKEQEFQQQ